MAAAGVIEAAEPAEARGLRRDEVRLLVSDLERDSIEHARFRDLSQWFRAGDVLVVNTSATLNAAISAEGPAGDRFEVHVSTRLPGGFWTVEVRQAVDGSASLPYLEARPGMTLRLAADAEVTLLAPYPFAHSAGARSRIWIAAVRVPSTVEAFLEQHGFPIRYKYVSRSWPAEMYQTAFAVEPGSAEMPSAGRPFTPELVTQLVARGIQIAPLVLHTGVSSLESGEPPYEEFYRVPRTTAELVNNARRNDQHVVAVGTTVVRALETVTSERGVTFPGEGWTSLVISDQSPVRSVSGMITGLHEPRSTHLSLLERVINSVSSRGAERHASEHLARAYEEARRVGYLWHEFGDSHLILGSPPITSPAPIASIPPSSSG